MSTPSRDLEEILQQLSRARPDEAAWSALYDRMWPYVFTIMFRGTGGKSLVAEDLSQEVFLRLIQYGRFEHLRDEATFRAYLRRIAINLASTYIRREVSRRKADLEEILHPLSSRGNEPADAVHAAEVREVLQQVVGELSRRDRDLVEMLAEGLSLSEIAERLGIRYEAAGVRVHRLRQRLRKHLLLRQARENEAEV